MRAFLPWWLLLLLLSGASPGLAAAQLCHMPAPSMRADTRSDAVVMRASVGSVLAGYDNAFGEGEYQGGNVGLAFRHPWVAASASLPGYRLVRNGEARTEIGDVALDARGTVYRDGEGGLALGLGMGATLPSGNGNFGFGMGHTMLMPGLWMSFSREHLMLSAELGYGRAIGGHHGMHHGAHAAHTGGFMAGSIVQPMNASEVEHGLSLSYELHPRVRALGRLFGAIPVADEGGQAREIVALGAQTILGLWDLTLETQLPVVGSPFTTRLVFAVGAEW
ncbi:MAG: transporter [Myxococcales bacterium]